ncbi:VRR-NUC domain-containing protein [Phascolarctobacterium sp.]|uniref:VRR-NUC domain-containing protein n=1 Tax=Phascolarctobacterium sp. TaxID=2049039 RepID=UPI002A809560|nr:VRR-NUC domain-containing protein [Phascolarctobacterium sp.]MDY5045545.1 VRR-NUC domain-containing protein [Phascolarctobacterium sp.]
MREKTIEAKFVKAAKAKGYLPLKLVSPGFDGLPDRLVLVQGGKVAFVELKAPGKKPRALQLQRHKMLRELGFKVFVLDVTENINEVLCKIGGEDNEV